MATPVTDAESFKTYLRDRARETWNDRGIPYYLSFVATDLKKQGIDYHDFTGSLRLVQWASSEPIPHTRLIVHPTKKAKVGLLPTDAQFEFKDEEGDPASSKAELGGRRGHALINFVQSLTALPDDVAEGYAVPAKVLLALLKR